MSISVLNFVQIGQDYCRDMAVFRFFKMAAVRHLGFVLRLIGQLTKHSWWS